jgi:predicted nucleic acid-binding Zn ribbon protein
VTEDDKNVEEVEKPEYDEELAGDEKLKAGIDLVRRTLEEARAAARAQGKDAGRGRSSSLPLRRVAGRRRSWSGPGPDARDPQPLGRLARDVAKKRGWSAHVAEGTVLGQWSAVVGQQIADHATPTGLNDGVLSVAAESTAWATQLRMIQAQLLAKIAAAVGNGVVTSLRITGPAAPSWRKGPRHVPGRGPRDTYG